MRRFLLLALMAALVLPACESGVPVVDAAASITEADFLAKVSVIADDSMMGRANPSPGLNMTAQWIAEEFARYGLEPGGDDGTFIQNYRIGERAVDFDASSVQVDGGPALVFGQDVNVLRGSASLDASGPVVVVPTTLAGAQGMGAEDLSGKHVVLVPSAEDSQARRRFRLPGAIQDAEPLSVFMVVASSEEDWEAAIDRSRSRVQRITPWAADAGSGTAMFSVRPGTLGPILSGHGVDLDGMMAGTGGGPQAIQLPDLQLRVSLVMEDLGGFDMPNTVGILEGRDPDLRHEYIVYSGHMDHVGPTTPNAEGDSIRNGADDDASGTIAIVELAEAFSLLAEKPRRCMVILDVSGEESGLWGSRVYAQDPGLADGGELVANLNADMISRNAPDSIVVIGKEHSDLGETLDRVNAEHPELDLTASDDIWPEENFYRRSDHFNFARRGVPVLFFFCGIHEDYHGVDDEVEKMDITKATNTTRLMFYLGLELGNAPERPAWDPDSYREIVDMGG